jgi:hypothetical protein
MRIPEEISMAKKGGASGYGEGDNVHSGSGSKGKGAHIPSSSGGVVAHDGGDGRTKGGAGASDTEKTHNVEFAKGGDTPMFGEQEAGSRMHDDKSPSTGKPDSSGPGEKFAEGGSGKMFAFNPSVPAQAGITSAR